MKPLSVTGSALVGKYALEVGAPVGSSTQFAGAPSRAEKHRARRNAAALKAALADAQQPPDPPLPLVTIEKLEDGADAVTDRLEHANRLFKAVAQNQLLDGKLLTTEIGTLLGLLERLDRDGRYEEKLRVAKTLHGLCVLAFRWLDLVRSLRATLRAARVAGDEAGQAWALNELGALHLCAGAPRQAEECLERALALREGLGDAGGRCATRHNLDNARRDVARPVQIAATRRVLAIGGVVAAMALFGGGGAALGLVLPGGDDAPPTSSEATPTDPETTPTDPETMPTDPETTPTHPETTPTDPLGQTAMLRVEIGGEGAGTVSGAGIECRDSCEQELEAGSHVTLEATADSGSRLVRWEGVTCDEGQVQLTCTFTPDGDVTATAVFDPEPSPTWTLTVTTGDDGGSVLVNGEPCRLTCTFDVPDGTRVALEAQASSRVAFVGWPDGVCEEGSSTGLVCTLTIRADTQVDVRFERVARLHVEASGSGGVSVDPQGTSCGDGCFEFVVGTPITITPEASADWYFNAWQDATCIGWKTDPCEVVLVEDVTVVPGFYQVVD